MYKSTYFQYISLNKPEIVFNIKRLYYVEVNGHFHCLCQVSVQCRASTLLHSFAVPPIGLSSISLRQFKALLCWEGWQLGEGQPSPTRHTQLLKRNSSATARRESHFEKVKEAQKKLWHEYRGYRGYLYSSLCVFSCYVTRIKLRELYMEKKKGISQAILNGEETPTITRKEIKEIMCGALKRKSAK